MIARPGRLVLLGHPVSHSLSPRFQNAALAAAGIPLRYEAVDVAPGSLDDVLRQLAVERAAGNVTVPHKERVAATCARLTPLARRVGAVNTFWHDDGALVGDNTDVGGFDHAVRALLGREPRDLTVALLGAGGSAAAVLAAAAGWPGARVLVVNRSAERAETLCARFSSVARPSDADAAVAAADLVVNATTVGLHDDAFPVDPARLPEGAAVFDLAYRPTETAWVRAARDRGHLAVDGLPMLVEQGALAFERWFGVPADRGVMWRAATDAITEATAG